MAAFNCVLCKMAYAARLGAPHIQVRFRRLQRIERSTVTVDVKDIGTSPLFRLADHRALFGKQRRNFTVRIVKIARHNSLLRADDRTRRLHANFNPVRAVAALGCCATFGINVNRIVRARLSAGLAAYASAGVEIDNTVIALVQRLNRAYVHTGRIFTVVAPQDGKIPPGVGK